MKVNDLLVLVDKLRPILELYQGWSVEGMVEDIYFRCSKEAALGNNRKSIKDVAAEVPAGNLPPSVGDSLKRATGLERSEQVVFIKNSHNLKELTSYAREKGIKGYSQLNKGPLIELMLDFTMENLAHQPEETVEPDKKGSTSSKIQQKKVKPEIQEAVLLIPDMEKQQMVDYLENFVKNDILEIASRLHLRIPKNNTKHNLIMLIANHFGYLEMYRQVTEREEH